MKHHEQIDAFAFALDALISRYTAEFDLPVATIVGVLEDRKMEMLLERTVHFAPDGEMDMDMLSGQEFSTELPPEPPEDDDEFLF